MHVIVEDQWVNEDIIALMFGATNYIRCVIVVLINN